MRKIGDWVRVRYNDGDLMQGSIFHNKDAEIVNVVEHWKTHCPQYVVKFPFYGHVTTVDEDEVEDA